MHRTWSVIWLAIGWTLSNVHRILDKAPVMPVHPFLDNTEIDLQWLMKDIGELLFYTIMIFVAYKNTSSHVKRMFCGLIIVMLLEILNYLICFKKSEIILCGEGIVIFTTIILVAKRLTLRQLISNIILLTKKWMYHKKCENQ